MLPKSIKRSRANDTSKPHSLLPDAWMGRDTALACALKPVPASMMSAHSSWQHATLLMNRPSSLPFSTCCSHPTPPACGQLDAADGIDVAMLVSDWSTAFRLKCGMPVKYAVVNHAPCTFIA